MCIANDVLCYVQSQWHFRINVNNIGTTKILWRIRIMCAEILFQFFVHNNFMIWVEMSVATKWGHMNKIGSNPWNIEYAIIRIQPTGQFNRNPMLLSSSSASLLLVKFLICVPRIVWVCHLIVFRIREVSSGRDKKKEEAMTIGTQNWFKAISEKQMMRCSLFE